MPRAVRFDRYGDVDVLNVVDVERPVPAAGEALIRVKAAGINPGEAAIRKGLLDDLWPATFPSGEGSDLAGVVEEIGPGVMGLEVGAEVLGWTEQRASHAELVVVPVNQLTAKPEGVSWEAAGALFVAGTTAYATVRAVGASAGDTVVVSGAAGGVGSLAVQLVVLAGATAIGLAGEGNHQWLLEHGAIPVAYGDGVAGRIREVSDGHVDALIDTFGSGYVALAVDELGVAPDRVDTIIDRDAGQKYGVKMEGAAAAASADVLAELVALVDEGKLEVPIAHVYPLDDVRDAFRKVEQRHTRGKIVLVP
jgi:NADPH:quinone reductase-like Zn-dependent oxidoreductase